MVAILDFVAILNFEIMKMLCRAHCIDTDTIHIVLIQYISVYDFVDQTRDFIGKIYGQI